MLGGVFRDEMHGSLMNLGSYSCLDRSEGPQTHRHLYVPTDAPATL